MKSFLEKNWFKLSLLVVAPVCFLILIYGFVIYPENAHRIDQEALRKQQLEEKLLAETQEKERIKNLNVCLEESEFQEFSSHLALCADPNIGRSLRDCSKVYSGTKNMTEVYFNFEKEFPGKLPEEKLLSDVGLLNADLWEKNYNKRAGILNDFSETCNCGLEKTRRDELTEDKKYRDNKCYVLYGN